MRNKTIARSLVLIGILAATNCAALAADDDSQMLEQSNNGSRSGIGEASAPTHLDLPDGSTPNLQELSPQLDSSPPTQSTSTAPDSAATSTDGAAEGNIHKLSVSKHSSRLDTQREAADLAAPQSNFSLMNALFGNRGKDLAELYAERDTGYGVCGFIMSVPLVLRTHVKIMRCFPSMPAAEAKLRPGDFIISVDGRDTRDLPSREVWDYFTGMPGTEVALEIRRGRKAFNVTLKRMDIGRIPDFATRARFLSIYEHNGMSKFVQR